MDQEALPQAIHLNSNAQAFQWFDYNLLKGMSVWCIDRLLLF